MNYVRTFIISKTEPHFHNNEALKKIVYLPNFYPQEYGKKKLDKHKDWIDVSCFGAIRPLKNHVIQAIGALKFADKINKKLYFHINTGRVEQKGDSILHNLQSIFSHIHENGHRLVNHGWMPREDFIDVCKTMDIGMQVSFSETFNIVAADLVTQGVPIVGSNEIPWLNPLFAADVTDSDDIAKKLLLTYRMPWVNYKSNQYLLNRYTNKTKDIWIKFLKNE